MLKSQSPDRSESSQSVPQESGAERRPGLAVDFAGVNHSFLHNDKPVRALDDFNLNVAASEFVSIVGPSGCGKTTALSMVGGLLAPRTGSVRLDGKDVKGTSKDTAFLFARDALLPWRSARRNVEIGLEVRGVPRAERRQRAEEWLQRVRLEEFVNSDILRLSQGMRQRVAIARTLVQNPRLILMDEPFAALDAQTRAQQQEEFIKLWEQERPTVIFVTHDLEEAILLSDRVILMASRPGRIVADIKVQLPRPRTQEMRTHEAFTAHFDDLSARLREEVNRAEEQRQASANE
ncbi:ABC transporter ATP-binding protein [Flexivirga alba]|uniref:ABC transporter ATP-binding protein n=1 Tax=Flexivirga alba TaxID=702742 RepID=A0ABW2AJZ8_9MICO